MYPFLMKLYADGGYQGPLFRRAVGEKIMARVNVEIVKRSDHEKDLSSPAQAVSSSNGRSHARRCRRLARDWALDQKALAFLRLASIKIMLRELCNPA